MQSTQTPSKLTQLLTDETWDKRKRNTAARQFALGRETGGDVTRTVYRIATQGTVGRYDRIRARLLKIVAEASGCAALIKSESYHYQGRRLRYAVELFGYESDIRKAIALYEELVGVAITHVTTLTGDKIASVRRQWMTDFLNRISSRLHDVGEAPSLEFISEHHQDAYAELRRSPARWLRETV